MAFLVAATDWAAWVTAGATAGGSAVLLVSALAAWQQLKDAKVTRHGQLMVRLGERWDAVYYPMSELFAGYSQKEIDELLERLFGDGTPGDSDASDWLTLVQLLNLIEELADFRTYGAVTIDAIDTIWGDRIISMWRQWRPMVHELRRILSRKGGIGFQPPAFREFQQLAVELELRRTKPVRTAYHGLPAAVALAAEQTASSGCASSLPPGRGYKRRIWSPL